MWSSLLSLFWGLELYGEMYDGPKGASRGATSRIVFLLVSLAAVPAAEGGDDGADC